MGRKIKPVKVEKRVQSTWRTHALVMLVLASVTLGVYWQVAGHGFIRFDDPAYVADNPHIRNGLTWDAVRWSFGLHGYAANWHPLTWISHMIDVQVFGVQNAAGHHLVNVFLHLFAAMLLYLLLFRLTSSVWKSVFVAAVFALHPAHIESVAWVSERKDVLCAVFWMLTLLAYTSYARRPGALRYGLVMLSFVLGLLSKPMIVTLPFVLLLLDWWPLERVRAKSLLSLVTEKLPLFVLAGVSCWLTLVAQRAGGAVEASTPLSLPMRIDNALVACVSYVGTLFWPARLSIIHPHPGPHLPAVAVAGSALLLAAISAAVISVSRRRPYAAVGWLWFIVTLLPVLGLVQAGFQGSADRYTYIPFIGLSIVAAWGAADLATRLKLRTAALAVPAAVILLAMSICTSQQLGYWKDSETLFGRAVELNGVNSATAVLLMNLGTEYSDTAQYEKAAGTYTKALSARPDDPRLLAAVGEMYVKMERYREAVPYLRKSVSLDPRQAQVHEDLGSATLSVQDFDGAIEHCRAAIALNPKVEQSYTNLIVALCCKSRFTDAWHAVHEARSNGVPIEDRLVAQLAKDMRDPGK